MLMAIAFALAMQAATPAPAPAQPGPDIVVQGTRDVERRVSSFIRALTDVPLSGEISRFDWAVCPAVAGLSDRQNDTAAERMRAVADAAGIPVGKANCKPNVLVVVTTDTQKFVASLKGSDPTNFDGVPPREMDALRHARTAAAWHIEGRLDGDGREVPRDAQTGEYMLSRTDVPSRISTTSRPHFVAAIVVVDSDALSGLTVVQLADYAAMRAFAHSDPTRLGNTPAPSILTILDAPPGTAIPITMTQWDFAYLKALYASTENRLAGQQRHEMARQMANDLKGPHDKD
jgi:hypothetical protein